MVESVNQEVEEVRDVPPQETERQPQERRSVRESLERTFEDAHKEEERETKRSQRDTRRDTNRRDDTGQFLKSEEAPEKSETVETPETEETPTPEVQAKGAPASWGKSSKEAWSTLPEQVRAEVLKRESDMEKGVASLKAKYDEVDKAIAPHLEAIKQYGKTPGQAVGQLFAWFEALAKNPDQAIPALIQSYNYDPRKIMAAFGIKPEVAAPKAEVEEQPEGDIPPAVQQYISKLEERQKALESQVGQQLNGVTSMFQEQSMAKTHEVLNNWAKDKPYFNEVRTFMGHLLTPDPNTGVAAVPLKDGRVDLDSAYEMAVYANPEIRAKILAENEVKAEAGRQAKIKAEQKAQQEAADKARRASGSIKTASPGADVARKVPTKGKSVRESIQAAREELSS